MERETGYHHGDLRRALLDAALKTISETGASGLTLRGVARAAKVSHSAPYHHFRNKNTLLAAVAEEGFNTLRRRVEERAEAADAPSLALQEAAVGYVLFAVENPDLFRVMFGPHLSEKKAHPSLQAASRAAYRVIEENIPSPQASNLALASWSCIHGLAMLLIDQQFGTVDTSEAEELARQITNVFWLGLSNFGANP